MIRYATLARVADDLVAALRLFNGLASLVTLIFGIVYLLALEKISQLLAQAMQCAEQTWARPQANEPSVAPALA